jgi:hypothetical protein
MKRIALLALPLSALLASLTLMGCASTAFDSRTDLLGDFTKRDQIKPAANTPRLYIETAPDDFEMKGGEIAYDKIRYEYIGKIFIKRNFENWRMGYVDYNETWRKYYCPPIMTLTYATLMVPFLTPLPYFCGYENSASIGRIEERKKFIAYKALEEGKKIGATHIVFAQYTGIEYPEGAGGPAPVDNGQAAIAIGSQTQYPYMGMVAHAFRKK